MTIKATTVICSDSDGNIGIFDIDTKKTTYMKDAEVKPALHEGADGKIAYTLIMSGRRLDPADPLPPFPTLLDDSVRVKLEKQITDIGKQINNMETNALQAYEHVAKIRDLHRIMQRGSHLLSDEGKSALSESINAAMNFLEQATKDAIPF